MKKLNNSVSDSQAIKHAIENSIVDSNPQSKSPTLSLFSGAGGFKVAEMIKYATEAPTEAETKVQREEAEAKLRMAEILDKALQNEIRVNDRIPKPDVFMSLDGVPVIINEELTAIKAKAKAGKTSTVKIFCAAMLGCNDFRLKSEKKKNKILFIDTEQSRYDVQGIAIAVQKMSGMNTQTFNHRFRIFYQREKTPEERLEEMEALIMKIKPSVIIIDNVADLTHDFNVLEESKTFVDSLMKIASQNHCAVMTVQHENKGADNTHSQGHLGAMIDKRASVLLQCVKDKGMFLVKNAGTRHIEVPEFAFRYDDEGNLVDGSATYLEIKEMQAQKKQEERAKKQQQAKDERWEKYRKVLLHHGGVLSKAEYIKLMIKELGIVQSTVYNHIKEYKGTKLREENGCIYLIEKSQES